MNWIRLAAVSGVSLLVGLAVLTPALLAQGVRPKSKEKPKTIIFSVLQGGTTVEPIAFVEKKKLSEIGAGVGSPLNASFVRNYYRPGSRYNLIFGGAPSGEVSIRKSWIGTECGGSSADVQTVARKAPLKGNVMGLATNAVIVNASSWRRAPTPAERAEIEALVRSKFAQNGARAAQLRSHNLTAVDIDRNGVAELVGSYWTAPKADERATLFIIGERVSNGRYALTHFDYTHYKPGDVMSGDITDLDGGTYQSLLLDAFDVDEDGTDEIFTIQAAFEGNNYHVYSKSGDKWRRTFETYVYRCGY